MPTWEDDQADSGASSAEETAAVEAAEAVEADLDELSRVAAERDEYLDALRRLQADFDNYRKRMIKQQTEHSERAAEALVVKLLPVLDTFDLALAHGEAAVEPIHRALLNVLEGEGLDRLDPLGKPFDPAEHEAVAHEAPAGDGGEGGEPVVSDVMRAGYRFKGRVLRPAMVKVTG